MDMIVRSMFQDSLLSTEKPELDESIRFRDDDVNRLYFLLTRLLKNALRNQSVAEKFGLSNEKILSAWYLTVNIENIADCCKNISKLVQQAKKDQLGKLVNVFQDLEKNYLDSMKAYYNHDKFLADEIAKKRISLLKEVDTLPLQYGEHVKLMVTLINNIARAVIDEE